MSNQILVYPNTVTALLSHRVTDKTIAVELGELNILIAERLYVVKAGENITVPHGTLYAYANLTPSPATVTERIETTTFAKDTIVHADVNGVIYDKNPAPATQSSHSLYLCLVDMLINEGDKKAA